MFIVKPSKTNPPMYILEDTKSISALTNNETTFSFPKNIKYQTFKNYENSTSAVKNLVNALSTDTVEDVIFDVEKTLSTIPAIIFTDDNGNEINANNRLQVTTNTNHMAFPTFKIFSEIENLSAFIALVDIPSSPNVGLVKIDTNTSNQTFTLSLCNPNNTTGNLSVNLYVLFKNFKVANTLYIALI